MKPQTTIFNSFSVSLDVTSDTLFGYSTAPLDHNLDGNIDYLIVGAPGVGCVYLISTSAVLAGAAMQEPNTETAQQIISEQFGFGSAVADMGDMNQDVSFFLFFCWTVYGLFPCGVLRRRLILRWE